MQSGSSTARTFLLLCSFLVPRRCGLAFLQEIAAPNHLSQYTTKKLETNEKTPERKLVTNVLKSPETDTNATAVLPIKIIEKAPIHSALVRY
jgi:hypothetical protein